jgi:ABC-type uncharacterized transport system permease subunit
VPDIVIHVVASGAYAGLAWHFWRTHWRRSVAGGATSQGGGLTTWERSAILVPLALHGSLLYEAMFAAPELRFGFASALSAMLWLAVLIYWIESLLFDLAGMQPLVLGAAGVVALLPVWFPGRMIAYGSSPGFKLHLILAIVAYSVFTIAILHAVLMAVVDRLLHNKLKGPVISLPPLLTIEKMFFRLVGVAFVFLTATLATGMLLSDSLFGRAMRFNHETVFAVLSWFTFAVLLWGRLARGWRGRTALRWTVAGFIMVVLANIGTAFVLEVILRRP